MSGHVPVGRGQQTPAGYHQTGIAHSAQRAPARVVVVQQVAHQHVGAPAPTATAAGRVVPGQRSVVVRQGSEARQVPGTEAVVFNRQVSRR